MKIMVIFAVVAYTVLMTLWASYVNTRLGDFGDDVGWDNRPEPAEASKLRKGWKIVFILGTVLMVVVLGFLIDNWQTILTFLLISEIIPIAAKNLKVGFCYVMMAALVVLVIWQMPSATTREERIVDEVVEIATPSGFTGEVNSTVVEDRGQYLFLKENEDSSVVQEAIPANVVNGHYISDDENSVVVYHYADSYKRTFWSKERTKFVGRKLWKADLYVKRDQLLNTF